jgi:hypothetical protein
MDFIERNSVQHSMMTLSKAPVGYKGYYTKAPKVVLQNMSQTRFESEAILKGTRGIWRQPIHCTFHRKFLLSAKGIKSTLQITVVLARVHISILVKLAVVRV